jgi:ubiquinone/menaquinone biosynthesis C-methylase UbiE
MTSHAFEHPYDDWADIYDRVYAYLNYDTPFYVQQATASNGPVLELGCGTGRVSIAMARADVEVVGVDISPRMVEIATGKAEAVGVPDHCQFVHGDMRSVDLGKKFSMVVMPFRSFQSMLTVKDQLATLANVRKHLTPEGELILDIVAPDVQLIAVSDPMPFHVRDVPQPDKGHTYVIWGQNSWDGTTQVNSARLIIDEVNPQGEAVRRLYRDFPIRYTFRYEMEHLLHRAGFTPEALYGGFDGEPLEEDSEDQVWIARQG